MASRCSTLGATSKRTPINASRIIVSRLFFELKTSKPSVVPLGIFSRSTQETNTFLKLYHHRLLFPLNTQTHHEMPLYPLHNFELD